MDNISPKLNISDAYNAIVNKIFFIVLNVYKVNKNELTLVITHANKSVVKNI